MADLACTKAGAVATITINRPEQRNAMTDAMWQELSRITRELAGDRTVRVVVVRGAGSRLFAAGGDLREFQTTKTRRETAVSTYRTTVHAIASLADLPQPVIGFLNGAAIGSGMFLALACDVRVATGHLKTGVPAANIGLTPGHPHIWRLIQAVGVPRAMEMLITGRLVGATEALHLGLVTHVVPEEEAEAFVENLAAELAAKSPRTLRWTKAAMKRCLEASHPLDLIDDAEAQADAYETEDFQEGLAAFREKRRPVFRDR